MIASLVAFGSGLSASRRLTGTTSERLGGSPSCLFDSAGVVVLMSRESGTSGKGLLAVGKGALVRSLARVDPTMPGQRAAITEGLYYAVSGLALAISFGMEMCLPFRIAHTGEVSRPYAHACEQSEQSVG